jgi:putative phosphoesterase
MNVVIFSDLHGRIDNILPILENNDYDEYIFAGDFFGYFKGGNDVLDMIKKYNIKFILGNHDIYFIRNVLPDLFYSKFYELEPKMISSQEYEMRYGYFYSTIQEITKSSLEIFETANLSTHFLIDNLDFFTCHGSPDNIFNEYIYPDYKFYNDIFDNNNFDILVLGHTHKSFIFERDGRYIINPGSCTIPRGDESPTIIICNTSPLSFKITEIPQTIKYKAITRTKIKVLS